MKKQETEKIAMLLESQYSQFKEGLNVTKPKGGAAFVTDFDLRKDLLAITHQQKPESDEKQSGFSKPLAMALGPTPKKANESIENTDLPKFEDD